MENRLNDLTGSEWVYWTNSIYETFFPPDRTHHLRKRHGAMKPPQLMAEIVSFFTKKDELILDPFAGVGGTLIGANLAGRRAIGIEINPLWTELYQKIKSEYREWNGDLAPVEEAGDKGRCLTAEMIHGDCLEVMKLFKAQMFASIISDPPYGCHHGPAGFKSETNFNMGSSDERDFANSRDYQEFLSRMESFGREAYRLLLPKRYLVLLIGDRYHRGEYLPLGFLVAESLRKVGFKWKGIRIWWNKATQRPLKPYAVKSCFIPNITHQNILILRKD